MSGSIRKKTQYELINPQGDVYAVVAYEQALDRVVVTTKDNKSFAFDPKATNLMIEALTLVAHDAGVAIVTAKQEKAEIGEDLPFFTNKVNYNQEQWPIERV